MKPQPAAEEAKGAKIDKWVPTSCWLCVEGPDLLRVHVVNDVVVNIEGNAELPSCDELTPNQGRICPKPYGLIQKLYNPFRLKNPMKRTSPEKGRGIDPKWVEISWEEALELVAEKLKQVRASDSRRLAATFPTVQNRPISPSIWAAFNSAFGPTQQLVGGGQCPLRYGRAHVWKYNSRRVPV